MIQTWMSPVLHIINTLKNMFTKNIKLTYTLKRTQTNKYIKVLFLDAAIICFFIYWILYNIFNSSVTAFYKEKSPVYCIGFLRTMCTAIKIKTSHSLIACHSPTRIPYMYLPWKILQRACLFNYNHSCMLLGCDR